MVHYDDDIFVSVAASTAGKWPTDIQEYLLKFRLRGYWNHLPLSFLVVSFYELANATVSNIPPYLPIYVFDMTALFQGLYHL